MSYVHSKAFEPLITRVDIWPVRVNGGLKISKLIPE